MGDRGSFYNRPLKHVRAPPAARRNALTGREADSWSDCCFGRLHGHSAALPEMETGVTTQTMEALVYHGAGKRAWEKKPGPQVRDATDAVVRITTSTAVNSSDGKAVQKVMDLTGGAGVDVAIEAVGMPATFDICQEILAPGGHLANVGVHGKPVELHLEKLWDRNITLTTRLVDTVTTPMLLKVVQSGRLQPEKLVTHRFGLAEVMKAYDTFGNAAKERALKVVLKSA